MQCVPVKFIEIKVEEKKEEPERKDIDINFIYYESDAKTVLPGCNPLIRLDNIRGRLSIIDVNLEIHKLRLCFLLGRVNKGIADTIINVPDMKGTFFKPLETLLEKQQTHFFKTMEEIHRLRFEVNKNIDLNIRGSFSKVLSDIRNLGLVE